MKFKTLSDNEVCRYAYYDILGHWAKAHDNVVEYEKEFGRCIDDDYYNDIVKLEQDLWDKMQELHDILLAYERMENRKIEPHDFLDDSEKMRDFCELSKEDFLASYSYLTEEDYNLTMNKLVNK